MRGLTDAEADLLGRTVDAFELTYRGLDLDDTDRQAAQALEDLDLIDINPESIASPTEEGEAAWRRLRSAANDSASDTGHRPSPARQALRDLLDPSLARLLGRVVDAFEETYRGLDLEQADRPAAERLMDLDLIDINPMGVASPTEEGEFLWREGYYIEDRIDRGAGAVLEALLTKVVAEAGGVSPALPPMVMRQRQNLGRQLQANVEKHNPIDLCRDLPALPEWGLMRELRGVRCGESTSAPALVKAGLAESVDGVVRLTERQARWHITQAGNLRIDGADVASGPTHKLRLFGTFLHDVGYPKVTAKHRLAFEVGRAEAPRTRQALHAAIQALRNSHVRPETMIAPAWIRLSDAGRELVEVELSDVTAGLIHALSMDGGQAEETGLYLGVSRVQWDAHKAVTPRELGSWGHLVLRMLPAHPRVVSWALHLEEPLGLGVARELLRNLQSRGLANVRLTNEWCITPRGRRMVGHQPVDLVAEWARQQAEATQGHLFQVILPELRRELARRTEGTESWRSDDSIWAGFVSYVLRYVNDRNLSHGCELAHILWSGAASTGVCLSDNEVALLNSAIAEDGADLSEHRFDVGPRLEALGYVEIVDGRALPLKPGRDASELYEPSDVLSEWDLTEWE